MPGGAADEMKAQTFIPLFRSGPDADCGLISNRGRSSKSMPEAREAEVAEIRCGREPSLREGRIGPAHQWLTVDKSPIACRKFEG